ncbi:MAG: gliding motility-associated C-terminal domain-containing protein [Bacteroidota bacterium]
MRKVLFLFTIICQLATGQQLPVNCNLAIPGCSTPSFGIVGTQPTYNVPDFTSGSITNPSTNPQGINSGCLLSGETVSTFITINVVTSGTLEWSIIGTQGGCFDWIMWQMPNADPTQACAGINGNTLPPVACNWNGACNGNTGMAPAGSLPTGGDPSSYQPPLNVTAGQSYMLCLSNYSFTNQNVDLDFFGSAQVVCGVSAADQTICQGTSATVNIATPGLPSPQFTWLVTNGVSNTSAGTNVTVTPTVTTTYAVQVFQPATLTSSQFLDTVEFTITVVPPPAPNAGIDDTVCLGQPIYLSGTVSSAANQASWQVITTGITPTPTVTFSPNFNNLTPTVTVNQLGVYQFVLRENNTICGIYRDTVSVLVTNLTQTATSTAPSCAGSADGSITIVSPNADEYSFDGGVTWGISSTLNGVNTGNYTVCSRNALGCQTCTLVSVPNPAPVTISVSSDTLICENGTATLTATAVGGSSFVYYWSHTSSTSATQLVSPENNETYTVYAENQGGCVSPTETIVVSVRTPISGIISPEVTICPGYPTNLTATAAGGIGGPYTFNWSNGQTNTGTTSSITVNPSVTTNYTVTIEDACESSPLQLITTVLVAPVPVPLMSVLVNDQCEPAQYILINETDPTMVGGVYWEVSNGDIFVNSDTVTTNMLSAGLYDVFMIVTSPDGCIDSTLFNNIINVNPLPIADFTYSPNPVLMFNTQVQFINYSSNGESYEWFFEGGNPGVSQQTDVNVMYPDGVTGEYDVTLIATSEFGCIDTTEQTVIVLPEIIMYAPNAFTPDNDEFNQDWGIYIEGIDIYDFELLIFNRWGEIIWESYDPSARWDGTYGGVIVQDGVYNWTIRTKNLINDDKIEFKGSINVIR